MDHPSRPPRVLTLARIVVFLQLLMPLNFFLETVAWPRDDADPDTRLRLWYGFGLAPVLIALGLFAGIRLGAGRPIAWLGAITLHVVLALLFAGVVYGGVTADAEHSPLAMFAIIFYSPVLVMSIVGLALLLTPTTIAYTRRSVA